MTSGVDIWGIVAGVVGVFGLIPMIYSLLVSQLPVTKLAELVNTLEETESLLRTATEEGLLKDITYVTQTRRRLHWIHSCTEDYRVASHCATTLRKQFRAMLAGLSGRISLMCEELKQIRAELSEIGSIERKRLMARNGGVCDAALLLPIKSPLPSHSDKVADKAIVHVFSDVATDHQACFIHSNSNHVSRSLHFLAINPHTGADSLFDPSGRGYSVTSPRPLPESGTSHHNPRSGAHALSSSRRYTPRLYLPRATQRLLQRIDRDVTLQGQRHPVLARLIRSKYFVEPHHVSLVRAPDEKYFSTLFSPLAPSAAETKVGYTDEERVGDGRRDVIVDTHPVYSETPVVRDMHE